MNKVLAIIGPTCSGKTGLAIDFAKTFNGEIISADSRQVYKGLDIGTGKVTEEEAQGIEHHLIDVCEPKEQYSVAQFKSAGLQAISEIQNTGKLPIIAGGTGQYVDALLYESTIPEVPPNKPLREELEKKSTLELIQELEKKDPERAKTIEQQNRRRLIRALEIIEALGKVPKQTEAKPRFQQLILGIEIDLATLDTKIHNRLMARIKDGMIEEAKQLYHNGLSYERMEELGLEYRYMARYLRGELSKDEMLEQLEAKIRQYARRQRTWWRNRGDIKWINSGDEDTAKLLVRQFLQD